MATEVLGQGKVGTQQQADGTYAYVRLDKSAALVMTEGHADYQEPTLRGNVYTLTLNATTTGVAAGNIVAAAAAASTQFAVWNPIGSPVNLVLLKFYMGIISGTPGGGPLFHGAFVAGTVPTIASVGTPYNNLLAQRAGYAKFIASAAGAALTGGPAPIVFRPSAFSSTATAQASVGEVNALEIINGDIILPPGTGWVPLWSASGTSLLNAYSVTWEEVPF